MRRTLAWSRALVVIALLGIPSLAIAQDLTITITQTLELPQGFPNGFYLIWFDVCNEGSSPAPASKYGVYFHSSTAPDAGCADTPDQQYQIGTLSAGQCVSRTAIVQPPGNGSFTAWIQADSECTVAETDENNNLVSSAYSALPSFVVVLTVSSIVGNDVTFNGHVRNIGFPTDDEFQLAFYSDKSSAPACGDSSFDDSETVSGLGYGPGRRHDFTFTTNKSIGAYKAWVFADYTCSITQGDATKTKESVDYYIGPNLKVFTPTIDVSGSSVTYKVQVCNNLSSEPTTANTLALYYDLNAAPTCGTQPSHVLNIPVLAEGACEVLEYTAPPQKGGDYTAYAFADHVCSYAESLEDDNISSAEYTVPKPDFYIKSFSASVTGDDVTYSVEVCNSDQGASTDLDFDVTLFFDRTSAPTCSTANPDHTWAVTGGLDSGACAVLQVTENDVLPSPPQGYKAWVMADGGACDVVPETDEGNNTASHTYAVAAQEPNLNVSSFEVEVDGQNITYKATICNSGLAVPPGTDVVIGFYEDAGADPACDAVPTHIVTHSGGFPSGCIDFEQQQSGLAVASYTAYVFVDQPCDIDEFDESDNWAHDEYTISPPDKPDLVVDTLTVTPVPGGEVTLEVKVCNNGSAASPADEVGVWFDRGAEPTCSDTPAQTAAINALAVAACQTVNLQQTGVGVGNYTAWAMVDPQTCDVEEEDELNNTASQAYEMTAVPEDAGTIDISYDVGPLDLGSLDFTIDSAGDTGVDEAGVDAGVDGPADDAQTPDQGTPDQGGTVDQGGTTTDSSSPQTDGGTEDDGGCCSVGHTSREQALWYMLAFGLILAFRRRRRRR